MLSQTMGHQHQRQHSPSDCRKVRKERKESLWLQDGGMLLALESRASKRRSHGFPVECGDERQNGQTQCLLSALLLIEHAHLLLTASIFYCGSACDGIICIRLRHSCYLFTIDRTVADLGTIEVLRLASSVELRHDNAESTRAHECIPSPFKGEGVNEVCRLRIPCGQ